jgi:putative transcriptional regulator
MKKPARTNCPARGKGNDRVVSGRGSSVGAEILEVLEEVRDALNSGEPLERRFTVRSYRLDFAPNDYGPAEVRSVRRLLGLSQPLFADFLSVDASTVRSWEQGTRLPSMIARRFMDEITLNPEYWRGRLRASAVPAEPRGTQPMSALQS